MSPTPPRYTPADLDKMADGCEREAKALDREFPEPDAFCSSRGGDQQREMVKALKFAAGQARVLDRLREWLDLSVNANMGASRTAFWEARAELARLLHEEGVTP